MTFLIEERKPDRRIVARPHGPEYGLFNSNSRGEAGRWDAERAGLVVIVEPFMGGTEVDEGCGALWGCPVPLAW